MHGLDSSESDVRLHRLQTLDWLRRQRHLVCFITLVSLSLGYGVLVSVLKEQCTDLHVVPIQDMQKWKESRTKRI